MDHRVLDRRTFNNLWAALRTNGAEAGAIIMDRRNTSFVGVTDEVTDAEVINAIKSVPCHY